jgi:hypothetical protein
LRRDTELSEKRLESVTVIGGYDARKSLTVTLDRSENVTAVFAGVSPVIGWSVKVAVKRSHNLPSARLVRSDRVALCRSLFTMQNGVQLKLESSGCKCKARDAYLLPKKRFKPE